MDLRAGLNRPLDTLSINAPSPGVIYGDLIIMGSHRHTATRRRHTNVLQHLAGHFKQDLDSEDRAELTDVIDRYREGGLPLVVPITLLRHHTRRHGSDWVRSQTYLNPYPDELMLRNHV